MRKLAVMLGLGVALMLAIEATGCGPKAGAKRAGDRRTAGVATETAASDPKPPDPEDRGEPLPGTARPGPGPR